MADASARGVAAPLALSARPDRAPPGSARWLSGRLSEPRKGHQNHPQGGRAEAGADENVQAVGRAGRGNPQYEAAQFAPARRDGNPQRGPRLARGKEIDRGFVALGKGAVEDHRRPDLRSPRKIRTEDAAR